MRWQMTWPDTVSGWCFWASLVVLVTVIVVMLAGAAAGVARVDGVAEGLLRVVQFGFGGVVASFLLGIVCTVVTDIRRKNSRG